MFLTGSNRERSQRAQEARGVALKRPLADAEFAQTQATDAARPTGPGADVTTAPDAGAYERSGDQNPGWVLQEGFKEAGFTDPDYDVGSGCCGKPADSAGGASEAATFLGLSALLRLRRRRA